MRAAALLRASSSETVPFCDVPVLFLGDPERDLGQVLELGGLLVLEGDLQVSHRKQHDPEEADKGQPDDHVNLASDREFEHPCPPKRSVLLLLASPPTRSTAPLFSGIMILKDGCNYPIPTP